MLLTLLFIWFTLWILIRLVKDATAITALLIIGWVVAAFVLYGLPRVRGG